VADPAVEALRRNLDTVNGTLNRVVDRLSTIETGLRSVSRPAPAVAANVVPMPAPAAAAPASVAAPPKPAPQPTPAASPPPPQPASTVSAKAPILPAAPTLPESSTARSTAGLSERLAAAAEAHRPAAPRERRPIDPTLPPDHPLEPGAAHLHPVPSPADRVAASEAALGAAKPPVIPDPGGKTNFIASARRAAQAALRLPTEAAAKDKAVKNTRAASTEVVLRTSLRERLAGRLRSILVATSVVLLTLAALQLAISLFGGSSDPEPRKLQTPAIAPQKSGARLAPSDALTAGAVGSQQQQSPGEQPSSTRSDPASPPAGTANPSQDVTGSISPQATAPSQPGAVPMPPNRPNQDRGAQPTSALAAAAEAGDPAAAYELAVRHIDGNGAPRSYEEAARWLTRASKHGLAPAQFRLGSLYEKGLGVKKNLNEARRLYTAAAGKGNAKAMHNLAVLHAEGPDGKPDYATALTWFRKAAERGIADSQYNLGVLYARGVGVEQNFAESYKWFALAAQQGDSESTRKRDDIAGRLDPESLMAARLAVKTWTMVPQPPEATAVEAPAGGWEREAPPPAPPPAAAKRRPRNSAPMKIGPG
jgi:localization factor PodJL